MHACLPHAYRHDQIAVGMGCYTQYHGIINFDFTLSILEDRQTVTLRPHSKSNFCQVNIVSLTYPEVYSMLIINHCSSNSETGATTEIVELVRDFREAHYFSMG